MRLAIMQWEEKWEVMMSETRRRCEDPGSLENVVVAGDLSKGCEGADVVEVGRSRRELRDMSFIKARTWHQKSASSNVRMHCRNDNDR